MKHLLILSGLMAASAFARDTAPRAPFIARQPLAPAGLTAAAPAPQMPAVTPALADPCFRDGLVKMTTVEDGMATLENRLRLLSSAITAFSDADKRSHQFEQVAGRYVRAAGRIGSWSVKIFTPAKPLVVVK